mmetsp:Transcript_14737/g.41212  ORF Transcript_14737/g.41212 Transcript_14737/m.41212 type:complete len:223 (+) Transcript_14737:913-1581(+)
MSALPNDCRLFVYATAVSCARRAAPSHRIQCVSRAGARRTCAYLKPCPTSPSTASAPTRSSANSKCPWPPVKLASIVSRARLVLMPGASIGERNIEAPTSAPASLKVRAMIMVKAAPSAPVMSHFSPLMIKPPLPSACAVVLRAVGSEPAPGGGSVIAKHERISPASIGSRYCRRWSSLAMSSSMCMLPSSGAAMLSATGPSIEYPASSKKSARVMCERSCS